MIERVALLIAAGLVSAGVYLLEGLGWCLVTAGVLLALLTVVLVDRDREERRQ